MSWLNRFFVKEPEPEVAWHIERWRGNWNRERWDWDHEPSLIVTCWANKAHAEESSRWDHLTIDTEKSSVTGPHPHKAGTCDCWRLNGQTHPKKPLPPERDWLDAVAGRQV